MKSCLFSPNNQGVINGVLTDRDRPQSDENGHVIEYILTGNVRDCEFNNVLVIGTKKENHIIDVDYMESLPVEDTWDSYIDHHMMGKDDYGVRIFVVPKCRVKENGINEKITTTNSTYTEIIFNMKDKDKGTSIKDFHMNINKFEKNVTSPFYIFITGKEPDKKENEFKSSSGYGSKITEVYYDWGVQVRS